MHLAGLMLRRLQISTVCSHSSIRTWTEHDLEPIAGKTTLLRIMAGDDAADGGVVRRIDGVRVGFLKQDPEMDPE